MRYTIGTEVFSDWTIVRELGEGSFGKVFEIQKTNYGVTARSALKVIRIPRSAADIKAALGEGMDEQSVTTYFQGMVDEIVKEIAVMAALKGHPNIVSCEDYVVLPHAGEIGWDILIRMELLTSLADYQLSHTMDETAVRRLGLDLCSALAFCQKQGLIHRDIKPENIFVSETGQFKLGDFGVARSAEKTTGGMSKKGTESYMAPEVYLGRPYGSTVDIYSLGLVLYKFLNNNRLPFLPPYPQPIGFSDRENAMAERMRGVPIPSPCSASDGFSAVILKACAYESKDRYRTAAELLEALQAVRPVEKESPGRDEESASGLWGRPPAQNPSASPDAARETEDGTVGVWSSTPKPAPAAMPDQDPIDGTVGVWGKPKARQPFQPEPNPKPEAKPKQESSPDPAPETPEKPIPEPAASEISPERNMPEPSSEKETPPERKKTIRIWPFLAATAGIVAVFFAVKGVLWLLHDKPMEKAWEAVYANILSDLTADGVDYSSRPMSSMDYAAYLQSKSLIPQLRQGNDLQHITWDSILHPGLDYVANIYWARTPEDPQCYVYVRSDFEKERGSYLSEISWNYVSEPTAYSDAGAASLTEIAPLPCGVAPGDDIDTICEKLGITQEMLDWFDVMTSWDNRSKSATANFQKTFQYLKLHDDSCDATTIEFFLTEEDTGLWSLRFDVYYRTEAAIPADGAYNPPTVREKEADHGKRYQTAPC